VRCEEDSPAYSGEAKRPDAASRRDCWLRLPAVNMDQIWCVKHAVVRWRENSQDAQNRMRNDLDDLLFRPAAGERRFTLSYAQMDAIIEAVIRIAMHTQPDDV
jgi:hypothetical protein